MFYVKFAFKTMKKDHQIYSPFIFAGMISVLIFYLFDLIGNNESIAANVPSELFRQILSMGQYLSLIIICVFLFLANGYLMKNKKMQLGIYHTLGMSKKQIIQLSFWETWMVALISIGLGILLGSLTSGALFVSINYLLQIDEGLITHQFAMGSVINVLVIFFLVYLTIWLYNSFVLMRCKTIELVKGSQVGEKEPREKISMAILGIIILGIGYYISVTIVSPMQAIGRLFMTALFIITGTYTTFTYTFIIILKFLKGRNRVYYQKNNFILLSNLLYRMKKNAVGMASVCLLSTAVIVIVSGVASLYAGLGDQVNAQFLKDVMVSATMSETQISVFESHMNNRLTRHEIALEGQTRLSSHVVEGTVNGNVLTSRTDLSFADPAYGLFRFIALEEYNQLENRNVNLEQGQVLLYTNVADFLYGNIIIDGLEYEIVEHLDGLVFHDPGDFQLVNAYYIIFQDQSIGHMHYLNTFENDGEEVLLNFLYGVDVDNPEEEAKVRDEINHFFQSHDIRGRAVNRSEAFEWQLDMYAGFLFVGMSFSILFIFMTSFVIYYRQISESYEDQKMFRMMKKIGLTDGELRAVSRKQILFTFFIPLLFVAVNVRFTHHIVTQFLMVLNLTNTSLFALFASLTGLSFVLVYIVVYFVTIHSYINKVSNESTF